MDTSQGLPLGYAKFQSIRRDNLIYADKTEFIYSLVTKETPYFLSRPRRFGKTLLISVIQAIFEGRRDLFKGLAIYEKDFDWEPHPVIRISMAHTGASDAEKLNKILTLKIRSMAKREDIELIDDSAPAIFESLIGELDAKYKNGVVVLIDEYDGPILDHFHNKKLAAKMRNELKDFYGALKNCEENLRFIFITGVSRFAKTSIFSGLNNLKDLTLDKEYANILGFTIPEFDALFKTHMEETLKIFKSEGEFNADATVDDLRKLILEWYDGYSWDGRTTVLNPWSTLNFFDVKIFNNFWFESGAPNFLINMIKAGELNVSDFHDNSFINESMNTMRITGSHDVKAFLFQTGYLTVDRIENPRGAKGKRKFYLRSPNLEIKTEMIPLLLRLDNPIDNPLLMKKRAKATLESLLNRDASGFEVAFKSFLNSIPFNIHTPYENYYSTLLILALGVCDQVCEPQKVVGEGVPDLIVRTPRGDEYVIEIKYVKDKSEKNEPQINATGETKEIPAPKIISAGDDGIEATDNKGKMETALKAAFAQIERNKYFYAFQGGGHKIYKVALVIGGRTDVMIAFQEAPNWILDWDEDENKYAVRKTEGGAA